MESRCGKQKGIAESRKALRKAERRRRKQKAIDESWKAVEENWKAVEENWKASKKNWITSEENWISGKESPNFPKRFSSFWKFWGLILLPDLLPRARMDYFVELKYSQLKINHLSDTPSTKGSQGRNLQ